MTTLTVNGMTCTNCARHVTDAIRSVPGVRNAVVLLDQKSAVVHWKEGATEDAPAVIKAITAAGYEAKELPPESCGCHTCHEAPVKRDIALWLGIFVTAFLMAGEWVFGLMMTPWFQWLSFALAAVVQVVAGGPFYRGAWQQLKAGRSNMDTLVALGSSTAFGYSAWVILSGFHGEIYFMEAAAIITLITIGHRLEARTTEKAGVALKALMQLAPQTARRIRKPDGGEPKPEGRGQNAESGERKPEASDPKPDGGQKLEAADLKTASFKPSPAAEPKPKSISIKIPAKAGDQRQKSSEPVASGDTTLKSAPAPEKVTPPSEISNLKSQIEPKVQEVPIAELKADDLVVLRPGDRVPVDGVIDEGSSAVNESMLTGESVPIDKAAGDRLFAGTINLNSRLVMRVTATGDATALAQVIAAVQRAQTSRADIQRLGDRISSIFVPVVVVIAILAGLWWGLAQDSATRVFEMFAPFFLWEMHPYAGIAAGFVVAAAVLIIACPCAMGLATPVAIMAAANAAARRGILIRDGVALEKAGRINAVLFDKTGTLTTGRMEVMTFMAVDPATAGSPNVAEKPGSNAALLQATSKLAGSLARHSSHPVSRAIAEFAAGDVPIKDWREIAGSGIEARAQTNGGDWKVVRLGSPRWFTDANVDLSPGEKFISDHVLQGSTVVVMTIDNYLAGLFAVRDGLKPRVAEVIQELQEQGLKTYLVTGDHVTVAMSVAKRIGISGKNVFAEMRPTQKAALLKELQAKGDRIAFVGDGINDAPALTQADLGIAMGRASDIARESADMVLLNSEVEAVPEALELARATLETIKQNLFWAFFYNAMGIPLAALGFVSPIFCAIAMGVSDLVVIGNALRLLKRKP